MLSRVLGIKRDVGNNYSALSHVLSPLCGEVFPQGRAIPGNYSA